MGSVKPQYTSNGASEPECKRKLFLGGLNHITTEETLRSHFEQWGEVVDCVVMRNATTKAPRGFGFVTYASSKSVDECQKNRPHTIDNRSIQPKRAIPRDLISEPNSEASIRKIYVNGLKDDITEEDLRTYFEPFGTISDILVVLDKETKKSRGFGFVEFDDYDPVDKLVMDTHHEINGKRVIIKKAMSKNQVPNKRSGPMNNGGWGPGPGNSGYNDYNSGYGSGYGSGPMGGYGDNAGEGYGADNGPPQNNGNWNTNWTSPMGDTPGPVRGAGANTYRSGPYNRSAPTRGGRGGRY